MLGKSFVTGILLTVGALWGHQNQPGSVSDDQGKSALQKVCVGCHELDTVTAGRRTEMGWQHNVEDMVARGAEGTDQELVDVVKYLTRNFGRINVNTASPRQLQDFLGLTEKAALAIASWRDRNGSFKDFEQLRSVPTVDASKLQEKRILIAFSE